MSEIMYGTEKLARLKKVLLHNPIESLAAITPENYQYHLFNFVPNIERYLKEHEEYAHLLEAHNVEVLQLGDFIHQTKDLARKLPNLPYLCDTAVITSKGAILSEMCPGSRAGEEQVVKEALTNIGIPIFHEFETHEQFEGCLILSPSTLMIVDTERLKPRTIEGFLATALEIFEEIVYIVAPQARRFMHADMIFGRISEDLALYFPPAFLQAYLITEDKKTEIDFNSYLAKKNIKLIAVNDQEQQNWGCSFVVLEPKKLIHYDIALNAQTQKSLKQDGVEIIEFHPEALLAGGGSLRCLTLRLWRN